MAPRSPAQADRHIEEMEQLGLNDSHLRQMRSKVEEERGRSHSRAIDTAQQHYETARRIGEEVRDEFEAIAERADAITNAIANGDLSPDEGRQSIDSLLGRHGLASSRTETFDRSADSAIAIEEDPESWSEEFFHAHPSVRPEMGW